MRYVIKPLQWIYCIYALLVFIALMLVVFPFVIVASFFGYIRGGNFIYHLCYIWADGSLAFFGIVHKKVYEAPYDISKQYVYVANHSSYLDIPQVMKAIRKPFRILGKIEMIRIPMFGYIYKRAVVVVDRSSSERRSRSVRRLKAVLRKGVSIFIFPEGTFNMNENVPLKEFYNGAFRLAIEMQTPIKPLLFPDNLKRMHFKSIFSLTPGRMRTIYLEEVPVEGLTLSDVPALKQRVYELMERKLREYRVGSRET